MQLLSFPETPFKLELSFYPLVKNLETLAVGPSPEKAAEAKDLLRQLHEHPELMEGITDASHILGNEELIKKLLADYFSPVLTKNEIRAVNLPYTSLFFNYTERFKNILHAAGPAFDINIRGFDQDQFFVMSCCIVLNGYYGTKLDFTKPMFYDIPTANGITRHYRILYNADFLEILPTEKSIHLSAEDIDLLIDNYTNVDLWKAKFPQESWILRGFAIITLFDATVENAVSIFKEKLLSPNVTALQQSIDSIFRSIFNLPDIQVGYTVYNQQQNTFSIDAYGQQVHSFILPDNETRSADDLLCLVSYQELIVKQVYFAVADTELFLKKNPGSALATRFAAQGIQSCILAPVVKNNHLFGVLEVVSRKPKDLNSINANKLEVVMPFMTDTIERLHAELQNQVQAIIQNHYTTIHSSVYWKFRAEALRIITERQLGHKETLNEIAFSHVYPLYGQIDIKGSSDARNASVQKDLERQLNDLLFLLEKINNHKKTSVFAETKQQIQIYLAELDTPLKSATEQSVTDYIATQIHPPLREIIEPDLLPLVNKYFGNLHKSTGDFHIYRRKYETTIGTINERMSSILDSSQLEAQAMFPHYYERFKTDGVEHNLYIGASIAPGKQFDIDKLRQLRFWQLRVLCQMEQAHRQLQPSLPYPLHVTTLVLVYHSTIAIRFRMDEKRFDVDGSYNARFEIVKKRIDKAHIKDTAERITEAGKITIVYSNDNEGEEYRGYIRQLQATNMVEKIMEEFEIEDLQGVSGLKALRVRLVH